MPRTSTKSLTRKAKQARSKVTVQVILDAAAQVLVRDGYGHATTNRIAERAGVSVGSLYQYFDDKDAVFVGLIDREVDAVSAIFEGPVQLSGATLSETLREILSVAVEAWGYGPLLYRQLEQVPAGALQARVATAKASLSQFIRSLLETHRAELRVDDLDVATFVVISASVGLSANATPAMYGEQLVEITLELLERYLLD